MNKKKVAKFLAVVLAFAMVIGFASIKAAFAEDESEVPYEVLQLDNAVTTGEAFQLVPTEDQSEGENIPAGEPVNGTAPAQPEESAQPEEPEEPETPEPDYYLTFSIAKAERVDKSKGTTLDGKKEIDYFQVKGVSDGSEAFKDPKTGAAQNRYVVWVNECLVDSLMTKVLGSEETVTMLNETNGDQIVAYDVERGADVSPKKKWVESVLKDLGCYDEVKAKVRSFMANTGNTELQTYLKTTYPDVDFTENNWYIDWYVMKTQRNGIHVDGVIVTIYDDEWEPEEVEWTVVYNFIKDGEVVGHIVLDDKIPEVEGTPAFTDDDIKKPSEVSDFKDDECELVLGENDEKFTLGDDRTIFVTYELKEPEKEPEEEPKEPEKKPEPPKEKKDIPFIPTYEEPQDPPVEEPPVEELPAEEPEVPASEPEVIEEVPTVPETPAGAVEEPEVLPVPEPEVPAGGDVLPQTGTTDPAVFYGFGGILICMGAAFVAVRKKRG